MPTIATQKSGVLAPISEMKLATRSKRPPGRNAASEPITIATVRMIGMVIAASISVVGKACSTTSIAGRENWMRLAEVEVQQSDQKRPELHDTAAG